jgi:hypothetical protein
MIDMITAEMTLRSDMTKIVHVYGIREVRKYFLYESTEVRKYFRRATKESTFESTFVAIVHESYESYVCNVVRKYESTFEGTEVECIRVRVHVPFGQVAGSSKLPRTQR